ncbi:MAG: TRAM domain-containing protein [bacterium]|nr:TRAM domain-containing protein [bacterium]
MLNVFRIIVSILCIGSGYLIGKSLQQPEYGILGSVLLIVIIFSFELYVRKIPSKIIWLSLLGLFSGIVLSNLLIYFASLVPEMEKIINLPIKLLLNIIFAYLGLVFAIRRSEDGGDYRLKLANMHRKDTKSSLKILDTSVVIDGRIADICEIGFIDGALIVPRFILKELQHIADSSDSLKRHRGRRGLDILNRIQKKVGVNVVIEEKDYPEILEVDAKLVKLSKQMNAKVITNDFNLNKVAELEGVSVLNINELAEALRPVVLPGEVMKANVIKEGKEHGQGVAYLDDGTMVVIDNGAKYIGKKINVAVTSVLQTTAGRMIFAKMENNS